MYPACVGMIHFLLPLSSPDKISLPGWRKREACGSDAYSPGSAISRDRKPTTLNPAKHMLKWARLWGFCWLSCLFKSCQGTEFTSPTPTLPPAFQIVYATLFGHKIPFRSKRKLSKLCQYSHAIWCREKKMKLNENLINNQVAYITLEKINFFKGQILPVDG